VYIFPGWHEFLYFKLKKNLFPSFLSKSQTSMKIQIATLKEKWHVTISHVIIYLKCYTFSSLGICCIECWRFSSISAYTAVAIFRVNVFGSLYRELVMGSESETKLWLVKTGVLWSFSSPFIYIQGVTERFGQTLGMSLTYQNMKNVHIVSRNI
jgi:hypothetical protein